MSGFVDGVNKFHVMYHEAGAMHCISEVTNFNAAERLLKHGLWRHDQPVQIELLNGFKERIDNLIQQIKDEE